MVIKIVKPKERNRLFKIQNKIAQTQGNNIRLTIDLLWEMTCY